MTLTLILTLTPPTCSCRDWPVLYNVIVIAEVLFSERYLPLFRSPAICIEHLVPIDQHLILLITACRHPLPLSSKTGTNGSRVIQISVLEVRGRMFLLLLLWPTRRCLFALPEVLAVRRAGSWTSENQRGDGWKKGWKGWGWEYIDVRGRKLIVN